jgi:hypothetical protein
VALVVLPDKAGQFSVKKIIVHKRTKVMKGFTYYLATAMLLVSVSTVGAAEHGKNISALEQLVIERDCEALAIAYTHGVDLEHPETVAQLFTNDGLWQIGNQKVQGRDAIHTFFTSQQAQKDFVSRHVLSNHIVTVNNSLSASGISYVTLYHFKGKLGSEAMIHTGHPYAVVVYQDEYVATKQGWKIKSRNILPSFVGKK